MSSPYFWSVISLFFFLWVEREKSSTDISIFDPKIDNNFAKAQARKFSVKSSRSKSSLRFSPSFNWGGAQVFSGSFPAKTGLQVFSLAPLSCELWGQNKDYYVISRALFQIVQKWEQKTRIGGQQKPEAGRLMWAQSR